MVPSSANDVSPASTDLFLANIGRKKQLMAKQFEYVENTRQEVGHWWWKHQRQKLGKEPTRETQLEVLPQIFTRCHQPLDDYG